jgi:hypothetical protein
MTVEPPRVKTVPERVLQVAGVLQSTLSRTDAVNFTIATEPTCLLRDVRRDGHSGTSLILNRYVKCSGCHIVVPLGSAAGNGADAYRKEAAGCGLAGDVDSAVDKIGGRNSVVDIGAAEGVSFHRADGIW